MLIHAPPAVLTTDTGNRDALRAKKAMLVARFSSEKRKGRSVAGLTFFGNRGAAQGCQSLLPGLFARELACCQPPRIGLFGLTRRPSVRTDAIASLWLISIPTLVAYWAVQAGNDCTQERAFRSDRSKSIFTRPQGGAGGRSWLGG